MKTWLPKLVFVRKWPKISSSFWLVWGKLKGGTRIKKIKDWFFYLKILYYESEKVHILFRWLSIDAGAKQSIMKSSNMKEINVWKINLLLNLEIQLKTNNLPVHSTYHIIIPVHRIYRTSPTYMLVPKKVLRVINTNLVRCAWCVSYIMLHFKKQKRLNQENGKIGMFNNSSEQLNNFCMHNLRL